jgi:hypothetical protein
MPRALLAALCLAFLAAPPAQAAFAALSSWGKDEEKPRIELEVEGVEGALLENVRALSSLQRMATSKELDAEMVGRLVQRAPGEVANALKPFGFYGPRFRPSSRRSGTAGTSG